MSDKLTSALKIKVLEHTVTVDPGKHIVYVSNNTPNTKAVVLIGALSPAWVLGGVSSYTDESITIELNNTFSDTMTGTCRFLVFY